MTHQSGKAVDYFWRARNAKTEASYTAIMTEMQRDKPAAHKYLSEVQENWQLYKAISSNHRLFSTKTSNLVEQAFSYTLEERNNPPYHYLKGEIKCIYVVSIIEN